MPMLPCDSVSFIDPKLISLLDYTDDTPIEYEPPSFKPCNLDIPLDLQPVKIGDIETQHHQMSCSVKSLCDVATTTAPQSGSETDVDVEVWFRLLSPNVQ